MNIDFELYRVFYAVANTGNITKASNVLNISQPAISKSIKNLEEQLGGKLFVRTKKGVILTEEGKEFYVYIKQAIEYITNAESKFTELINLETGCIRIGISTTLTKTFLIPYLEKFHSSFPNIEIKISTNIADELISKLRNGLLDIVILNLVNKDYGKDIETKKLKCVTDCFVVNKDYKYLLDKEISIKELYKYPLIVQTKGSSARTFLDMLLDEYGASINPSMELASYALIVEFSKIGFGIGYVTKNYINKELKNKELFELKIKEKIPSRYVGMALSKNHLPNFCTKKLIEIINSEK